MRAHLAAASMLSVCAVLVGCAGDGAVDTQSVHTATATVTRTVTHHAAPALPTVDAAAYAHRLPTTFGLHLPGITDTVPTSPGVRTIALTFDGCGGPHGSGVDMDLLDALRQHRVPATLFVSESWVLANPDLTRELVADPLFRVENHGTRHLPLSVNGHAAYGIPGTQNAGEVIEEIAVNRDLLSDLGVQSTWFRAGTAHYDDVSVDIARDMGVRIAGFHVNGDDGAQADAATVASRVMEAPDGSIILAHFNHPGAGTGPGVRRALEQLDRETTRFVFLDGTAPDS